MSQNLDGRYAPTRSFRISDEDFALLTAVARAAKCSRGEMIRTYIRAGAAVLERASRPS